MCYRLAVLPSLPRLLVTVNEARSYFASIIISELTFMEEISIWKVYSLQLIGKFPADGSLPSSQKLTTGSYTELDNLYRTHEPISLRFILVLLFASTPLSSDWSLPFRFPTKLLYTLLMCFACITYHGVSSTVLDFISLIIFSEEKKILR
jgi:hypothetical protein